MYAEHPSWTHRVGGNQSEYLLYSKALSSANVVYNRILCPERIVIRSLLVEPIVCVVSAAYHISGYKTDISEPHHFRRRVVRLNMRHDALVRQRRVTSEIAVVLEKASSIGPFFSQD